MPRTLPWLAKKSTTSASRAESITPRAKRPRVVEQSSDVENASSRPSKQTQPRFGERQPSTSPPPEPPEESFMIDGLDHDDKFRMVEDEFLETAKLFTQHLHAAEYRRMEEAARKQNADAIRSISRPVTQKMGDHTRRKVEGVARAKKQAKSISTLLGKNVNSDDEDSDEQRSAWVGTALHGLMESPKKSSRNLSRIGAVSVATKAAAGFTRPRATRNTYSSPTSSPPRAARPAQPSNVSPGPSMPSSPPSPTPSQRKKVSFNHAPIVSLESDDDGDDDLDRPVSNARASVAASSIQSLATNRAHMTQPHQTKQSAVKTKLPSSHQPLSIINAATRPGSSAARGSATEKTSTIDVSARAASEAESKARIARRLERANLERIKKDQEERRKRLDAIPTFL